MEDMVMEEFRWNGSLALRCPQIYGRVLIWPVLYDGSALDLIFANLHYIIPVMIRHFMYTQEFFILFFSYGIMRYYFARGRNPLLYFALGSHFLASINQFRISILSYCNTAMRTAESPSSVVFFPFTSHLSISRSPRATEYRAGVIALPSVSLKSAFLSSTSHFNTSRQDKYRNGRYRTGTAEGHFKDRVSCYRTFAWSGNQRSSHVMWTTVVISVLNSIARVRPIDSNRWRPQQLRYRSLDPRSPKIGFESIGRPIRCLNRKLAEIRRNFAMSLQ